MRATTALITINGTSVLKCVLVPENEKEREFLEDALEKADDFKLSVGDAACTPTSNQ